MVEVFKTNVQNSSSAEKVLFLIRQLDLKYEVNFDLEDCDKILRIEYKSGIVDSPLILVLIHQMGFTAEVLED
ncbi:MAG: hypothetical protein JNL60_17725 [Bacteroidia bacterium]|nr:hypothetical protein [Bacteroidia bacterium]